MRNGLIVAGVTFAVAMAYIIGSRLSNEAMAVVVGAVCGISASIPVSIGLIIASQGYQQRTPSRPEYPPQPTVIIVNQPALPGQPSPYGMVGYPGYLPTAQYQPALPPPSSRYGRGIYDEHTREWKFIGDE